MKKLSVFKTPQLETMLAAGQKVFDCNRVLKKSKSNVVGELIKEAAEFYEWDHYPKGDVYDNETHSQYYYHAHPTEERIARLGEEHGHFHTFVRPLGMPAGVQPSALNDYRKPDSKNDDICHLVGVSMDRRGVPIRLFTVNRWVTGETWYKAADVRKILDSFVIDLSWPSWPVNVWITSLIGLFRPQIEDLLAERDKSIAEYQKKEPDKNVFEDRRLEVTSFIKINLNNQISLIKKELKQRANARK